MLPVALDLAFGDVIIIVVLVALPLALITFISGARNALDQIGKGQFAVQFESDLPQKMKDSSATGSGEARDELRQLLEAKAYRQRSRGESPVDVDTELDRLLEEGRTVDVGADPQLVEEVRQLVNARNHRRMRQGKEPLDVEREVERQLRELENLGQ